jgi:hypothetical protein
MSDQAFKTPKAARRKVTTDLGRQIMQRERQRLAREQAALGEQLADEAKRALAKRGTIKRQVQPEQIAVSRGIVRRFAAVLQSEGVNAVIKAKPSDKMSAWTDFEQIVLNYRMHDDVRLLAATMRGLAYHEGGHCRFTIPFAQLVEAALGNYVPREHDRYHKAWNILEDQRMETAVVSDSPRKAAYITPVIMTEMTDTVSAAAANWPVLIWRKYLPAKIRKGARTLFVAQHDLMGVNGEALAKAWERVTTEYVMADNVNDMWTAVLTAHQLLQMTQTVPAAEGDMGHDQQTRAERDNLDDALVIPIAADMIPEGETFDIDSDEPFDVDTTDPAVAEHLANIFVALFSHPETLLRVVYAIPQQSNETAPGSGSNESAPEPSDEDDDESKDADADEDEADDEQTGSVQSDSKDADDDGADGEDEAATGSKGDEQADTEEDDDELDDEDESAEYDDDDEDERYANDGDRESGVDPEREGGEDGEHDATDEVDEGLDYRDRSDDEDDDDELSDDDLAEALAEAEAERDEDEALDGDVHAFQDVLDTRVSDLSPYNTHPSSDLEATAAAHNLANDLEQSFYASTMDSAPAWIEQQRRGVLNVMRYKTRNAGETEFFKQWTEDDQPGFNIAVSVLLDYSGSMGGYTEELAQAGYATKLACSKLGIPCTVVLWDTGAQVLWDANEEAEYLPVVESAGGTDPSVALADLPNQRYEKAQHIVFIMTDGEWQGNQSNNGYLAAYNEQGRIFIGCGFNSGSGSSEYLADKLRRYGCTESYAIKSLMEIPQLLEQTLVAVA